MTKEEEIILKIIEKDYDSESLVIGNVNRELMNSTKEGIVTGIGQNIAAIDLLDENMKYADSSNREDVIFEYFWGFVYQYLYSNPILRKKYMNSKTREKLAFFNSILKTHVDISALSASNLLFTVEPNRIIRERGEGDFKICILNYQEISSMYLAEYINYLTRERPQLTILTSEQGLKTNSTGSFYTSVGDDFSYYDIGVSGRGSFRIEKLKVRTK